MAKPDLGGKRQCQNCGTKFFDLNKDPIVCPKCGAAVQLAATARMQPRAAAVVDDDAEVGPAAVELVSLEDAEPGDDKVVATGDDIEIEDDAAADEPSSKRRRKAPTTLPTSSTATSRTTRKPEAAAPRKRPAGYEDGNAKTAWHRHGTESRLTNHYLTAGVRFFELRSSLERLACRAFLASKLAVAV